MTEPTFISDKVKDQVILVLRSFFADQPKYTWLADSNETKVIIADKYSYELEAVEQRPIISVQRGAIRPFGRHIGHFRGSDLRAVDSFVEAFRVDFVVLCLSRVGLEAETLAQLVFQFIMRYRSKLREKGFLDIKASSLGEERIAKSDSKIDISVVPVTISVEITDSWSVIDNVPEA